MRYWWVNQNRTYKTEVSGGFLWSPKAKKNGARNQFYENMREVSIGDVIFSYCETRLKAIGVATGTAVTAPKPEFGVAASDVWEDEGWLVPVTFKELKNRIYPKVHMDLIRPHLPEKYSPLQPNGDGLQSVYLAAVSAPMADVLVDVIGTEYFSLLKEIQGAEDVDDAEGDRQEEAIKGRTDIGATTREQLVKSRRGQGVFKANVHLNEKGCRVTGVTDTKHLRASHIKPWKVSSDEEKLNGCNGLLLAPHIDHLFDQGLISFSDAGDLLISPKLDRSILAKWGLPESVNVGPFNVNQVVFLDYHRNAVFKKK